GRHLQSQEETAYVSPDFRHRHLCACWQLEKETHGGGSHAPHATQQLQIRFVLPFVQQRQMPRGFSASPPCPVLPESATHQHTALMKAPPPAKGPHRQQVVSLHPPTGDLTKPSFRHGQAECQIAWVRQRASQHSLHARVMLHMHQNRVQGNRV